MSRKSVKQRALNRLPEGLREGGRYDVPKPGKETDFVDQFLFGIVVVMIVGALLSLWFSSST